MRRANDAEAADDDDDADDDDHDFERAFTVTARIHEDMRDDGTRAFDVDDGARAEYWKKSKSRANVVLVTFLEEYAREIEGGGRVSAAARASRRRRRDDAVFVGASKREQGVRSIEDGGDEQNERVIFARGRGDDGGRHRTVLASKSSTDEDGVRRDASGDATGDVRGG